MPDDSTSQPENTVNDAEVAADTTSARTTLFAGDECHTRYPVADILQKYEFAQFVNIAVTAQQEEDDLFGRRRSLRLLAMESHDLEQSIAESAAHAVSLAERLNGIPAQLYALGEKGLNAALSPPLQHAVETIDTKKAGAAPLAELDIPERARSALLANGAAEFAEFSANLERFVVRRMKLPPAAKGEAMPKRAGAAGRKGPDTRKGREVERVDKSAVLEFVGVIPWTQTWTLAGYSRGRLLHSLTLAPQEEATIEIQTWERRRRQLEQSSSSSTEQSSEMSSRQEDSSEIFEELTKSGELDREVGVQFRAVYGTPATGQVSFDANGRLAARDRLNEVARDTHKRVRDMTQKAASKVTVQRSSKISDSIEFGNESRVTRKVRNTNLSRTLSFDYFELLATYTIQSEPNADGVILCLLIRNPFADPRQSATYIPKFTPKELRIYEGLLRPYLISPELAKGFDAARFLESRKNALELNCEPCGCPTGTPAATGGSTGSNVASAPKWEEQPSWGTFERSLAELKAAYDGISQASGDPMMLAWDAEDDGMGGRGSAPSEAEVLNTRHWLYFELLRTTYGSLVLALGELCANVSGATVDASKLPTLFGALEAVLAMSPLAGGVSATDGLAPVAKKKGADVEDVLRPLIRRYSNRVFEEDWYWGKIAYRGANVPHDGQIAARIDFAIQSYQRLKAEYDQALKSVKTPAGDDPAPPPNEAQAQCDRIEYSYPLRDTADALEAENALLLHMDVFADYYRYVLLRSLPPAEQMARLGISLQNSQLAGFLQPRILTWRGEDVAVPVDATATTQLATMQAELASGLRAAAVPAPFDITVPTEGVSMEARLGRCSSVEPFIEETRLLELDQRRAELRRSTLECDRLQARLEADPKLLEPPATTPVLHVRLEQDQSTPA